MKLYSWLLLPVVAFAQLTPNSVTVTASRNTVIPSDQIVFNVTLTASPDASFEDVLGAASAAGLTPADFRAVNYSGTVGEQVSWYFTKSAPLADQKEAVGLLAAVQQNLAREKKFALSFQVGGSQLSPAAQQKADKCSLSDLIAEARTRAANLAAASGATAGAIQALTTDTGGCSVTVRYALGGIGQGGPASITITARNLAPAAPPSRISVTVAVSADVGVGLDQIVQAAAPAGVSASDLQSVGQQYIGRVCVVTGNPIAAPCNPVEWDFRITAPLAKWKDTLAALARARDANHPGITIDYRISADAPPQPECAMPTLVSQARRRAQDLAEAAGVSVGALSAVADGPPQQFTTPVAVFAVLTAVPNPWFTTPYAPACTAVAQFVMTP